MCVETPILLDKNLKIFIIKSEGKGIGNKVWFEDSNRR